MKKISEVETIYNAFKDTALGKMPKEESKWPEWYRDRMYACESCKYNTKNIPNKMIPTGRLYFSKLVGKYCCSICGCYIPQKCWSKVEQCSMGETDERPEWLSEGYLSTDRDETPKWNRMELVTMRSDEFNVISTDHKKYNIDLSEDGSRFVVTLAPTRFGDVTEFSFIVESLHHLTITGFEAGCQCTVPNVDFIDEKHFKVSIMVTTQEWGVGFAEKPLSILYMLPGEEKGSPDHRLEFLFKLHVTTKGMRDDEIAAVNKRNKELQEEREKERKAKEAAAKAAEPEPLNSKEQA